MMNKREKCHASFMQDNGFLLVPPSGSGSSPETKKNAPSWFFCFSVKIEKMKQKIFGEKTFAFPACGNFFVFGK